MKSETILSNFIWRLAERCGARLVEFLVSIVLARLLAPELYGLIALVTVFTTILNVFVDCGLGNALIQKKNVDDLDFSTVFYFNVLMCTLLYFLMFTLAPFIAEFYEDNSLVLVIRVLSFTLVISGVKNVQQAYVSRTMQFKRFFFSTLGGTIVAAIIGISMAYCGFGIWALVAQQIINATIDSLILWVTIKWRPIKRFSFFRLKVLFSYGWKLLVSALLDAVYNDIRQLVIGRLYSSSDLAYYNRGKQFPQFIISNVNASVDSVLLPTMSRSQDDSSRVKSMTRRAIKVSTYIISPLMIGLAFSADSIIKLLLTDKWLQCTPYLRIFCISFLFYPIHTSNLNAIKAMGRSDLFLKLEIYKKSLGIVLLILTMRCGPLAMAYSVLLTSVISQMINAFPNKKLLEYGYFEQLKDICPVIVVALVMGVLIYFINYLSISTFLVLLFQITVGGMFYISASLVLRLEPFIYILNIVKSFSKRG